MKHARRWQASLASLAIILVACAEPTTPTPVDDGPEPPETPPPNPIPSERVTVSGRVFTLTGVVPANLRVRAWTGIDSVSAPVEPDLTFSIRVPKGALDSTEFVVAQELLERDTHHPALRVFDQLTADISLDVLLLPREWTIETGDYAGQTVPVGLQPATAPENVIAFGDGQFFPVLGWPQRHDEELKPALWTTSWDAQEFPIPLYFKAAGTDYDGRVMSSIGPADSASFWLVVRGMERTFGRDLFRPATASDFVARTIQGNRSVILGTVAVRLLREPPNGFAGAYMPCPVREVDIPHAPPSDSLCAEIGPGRIAFAEASLPDMTSPYVIKHELLHTLGFGHGCWHPTIIGACRGPYDSQYLGRPGDPRYDFVATPFDVAYVEYYWAIHARTAELRPHLGLVEGLDGERRLRLGLGPIPPSWRNSISGDDWIVP